MKIGVPRVYKLQHVVVILFVIKTFLGYSAIIPYSDVFDDILAALATVTALLTLFFFKKYHTKELLVYASLSILSLITSYITGMSTFAATILTILIINRKNFDSILRLSYKLTLLLYITHTIYALFLMMVLNQSLMLNERYSFGMAHPNNFSFYFFGLCLYWIWFNFEKMTWKHTSIIMALNVVVYYYTQTDALLIVVPILLGFSLLIKSRFKKKCTLVLKYFVKYSILLFSFVSSFLTYLYTTGSAFAWALDVWLSSRIRHSAYAFEFYGLSLVGQNLQEAYEQISWNSAWRISRLILDNVYIFLPINMGVVWFGLISLAFYKLADIADEKTLVVLSCWSIYSLVERSGLNGYVLFPIFLIALLFQNKRG